MRIAVDGPSGAGKSTVAKLIAARLGVEYIDTGAMYRALALKILETSTDIEDEEALHSLLKTTTVGLDGGKVILDGRDVSGLIRTPEVTDMASRSSAIGSVREKLVALQRKLGEEQSVIMDGRDIGSNVFPDAEVKFFVTASPEVRAKRRYEEMLGKGMDADLGEVLEAINERDYNDSHRALNPLKMTEDAILLDTDELGIDEVVDKMIEITQLKIKQEAAK